jgi:hypothetical protein
MWVRRPGLPVLTDALSLLVEEAFVVAVDPACLPSIQRGTLGGCAAVWWVRFWGVIPTCPRPSTIGARHPDALARCCPRAGMVVVEPYGRLVF